jgi:hypothetical protein
VFFPLEVFVIYNCQMLHPVNRGTLAVWIGALAVLFSALAPSISHAWSPGRGTAGWAEICSATGARQVAFSADVPQKSATDLLQHHMEHCPYCATHGGTFALLPPLAVSFAILGGHDLFPSLYYHAPLTLFAWSAAQARGPPAAA